MTLLSDQEIHILNLYLEILKKERNVLKRVLHNVSKKYEKQLQLLKDIIQCKEDIEDYKKQYSIITTYNKEIGSHILNLMYKEHVNLYIHNKISLKDKIKHFFHPLKKEINNSY
jgi:hypothetical protein